MFSISLCMIVKDEEDVIERCLNSVNDVVDEIIIVDTGSKDNTVSLVKKFDKVKLYYFKWIDDFASARNYSFDNATKDYILWLDADDVLYPEDREKLFDLKKTMDESIDVVGMSYIYARDKGGFPSVTLKRNRLVKRNKNFKWVGRIHEYLDVKGKFMDSDITINHFREKGSGDRNLKIFMDMENKNENFTPRDLYYYANELYDHAMYDKAIEMYDKFIGTKAGWVEDIKSAYFKIGEAYCFIQDKEKAMDYFCKSLKYDLPRPDICCKIADEFLDKNNVKAAIFWYKAAIMCHPDKESSAIWQPGSYTFIPCIQLCVCYARLGNMAMANMYNEKAAEYKPNHPSVLQNRKYFIGKI